MTRSKSGFGRQVATALFVLAASAGRLPGAFALQAPTQHLTEPKGLVPGQKTVEVRLESSPAGLDVAGALARAIATWNAVLPDGIQLAETTRPEPPQGEVLLIVHAEPTGTVFKGGGVDEYGFTGSDIDVNKNTAVSYVLLNDTDVFKQAEGFATDGTAGKIDLELVILHELGHALGLAHASAARMPPVMAPSIEPNGQIQPAGLRRIDEADKQLLTDALARRKRLDPSGSYTGQLSASGRTLTLGDGEFVVEVKEGRVHATYKKTSEVSGPAVGLLLGKVKLDKLHGANTESRTLDSIELDMITNPGQLTVKIDVTPLRTALSFTGTLTKKMP